MLSKYESGSTGENFKVNLSLRQQVKVITEDTSLRLTLLCISLLPLAIADRPETRTPRSTGLYINLCLLFECFSEHRD